MGRNKIRQAFTFDPQLDAALRSMHSHTAAKFKGSRLNYNGYIEGILSAYVTGRFDKIPTPEEIDRIANHKIENNE